MIFCFMIVNPINVVEVLCFGISFFPFRIFFNYSRQRSAWLTNLYKEWDFVFVNLLFWFPFNLFLFLFCHFFISCYSGFSLLLYFWKILTCMLRYCYLNNQHPTSNTCIMGQASLQFYLWIAHISWCFSFYFVIISA